MLTLYKLKQIVCGAEVGDVNEAVEEIQRRKDRATLTMQLARQHYTKGAMSDSAKLCLEDAESCYSQGEYDYAHMRALDSLRYSVGVFHADYQRCAS